jgi:hypothetical protein
MNDFLSFLCFVVVNLYFCKNKDYDNLHNLLEGIKDKVVYQPVRR